MGHTDQAGPQGYQRQACVDATVAGPVSAALIQHRAGLPPARVGLPTPDVKGGRSPGCWGKIPPHPLYVAALRGRSRGLSSGMALCWSVRLPRLVLFPSPGSPGWVMLLKTIPWPTPGLCCSSSWEGPQYNRPGAPASRPGSLADSVVLEDSQP